MADVGTGATIAFGTSSWSASIRNIDHSDISRPSLDTSHLGTSANRTFMPGDLVDRGEIELEFLFDPDTPPPIDQAAETVTITFPLPSGQSTAADYEFTGFLTNWSYGVPLEELMTGSGTVKVSGAITETDSA